eukprot:scaffold66041_cov21-Tisochrysis_lutea.AAC.4
MTTGSELMHWTSHYTSPLLLSCRNFRACAAVLAWPGSTLQFNRPPRLERQHATPEYPCVPWHHTPPLAVDAPCSKFSAHPVPGKLDHEAPCTIHWMACSCFWRLT